MYLQAPRSITLGLDAGAGVTASLLGQRTMPYVELGSTDDHDRRWFGLAGYMRNATVFETASTKTHLDIAVFTIGYQFDLHLYPNEALAQRIFVQRLGATRSIVCDPGASCPVKRPWVLALGYSFGPLLRTPR